jgi:hypothetical protein
MKRRPISCQFVWKWEFCLKNSADPLETTRARFPQFQYSKFDGRYFKV